MEMAVKAIVCSRCGTPIPVGEWNREHAFCPTCRAGLGVLIFPALLSKIERPNVGDPVTAEGEASCFHHPEKRAAAACDQCGRFLCGLCLLEFLGQNWCPGCLEARRRSGQLKTLDVTRTLYDNGALALAIIPLLFFPLTLITAPIAIYVSLRYWRAPGSMVPRSRVRSYAAMLLAAAEIGAWVWILFYVVQRWR